MVELGFAEGGGGPLRFVFPGVVGEAVAAATSWNNAPTPPRLGGASLRCRRRVWELLFRSPGWSCVVLQVMLFLALFVKDAGCVVGVADGGRLVLARVSRGDGGRQRRAKIQELEALGRSPGRCATAEGFFYFDSNKSRCAMGLLQLTGALVFFDDGGDRRREARPLVVREGSRGVVVIFLFFRVLCVVWLGQLSLYPLRAYLYQYVFLTQ